MLEKILIIFATGFLILIGAIILNFFAEFVGLYTWYDLIKSLNAEGFKVFSNIGFFSFIYLFLIYPFLLGLIGYLFYKSLL